MDMHRRSSSVVSLAAATSLLLAACNEPPPATIRYEQRGACNGFKHAGGTTLAGANRAFVVFRVSTIDNIKPKAKDFDFNPERLYVDQTDPAAFVDTDFQLAALNPFALMGRLVKAGSTETFNGAAIAAVWTSASDGAKEASQKHYKLLYSPTQPPGSLTEDTNPSQTSWPYTPDCVDITF